MTESSMLDPPSPKKLNQSAVLFFFLAFISAFATMQEMLPNMNYAIMMIAGGLFFHAWAKIA